MKNLFRMIGIIALTTIILFTATACGEPDDNSGKIITDQYVNAVKAEGSDFAEKLNWVKTNASAGGMYAIEFSGNTLLSPQVLDFSSAAQQQAVRYSVSGERNASNKEVIIVLMKRSANITIELNDKGCLFTLDKNVKLVLHNGVTLKGKTDNNNALVVVRDGTTFVMENDSVIRENDRNGNGAGVIVHNGGAFIMNGGTITNCTVWNGNGREGGGVLLNNGSTFTMNNGVITNCAARNGAGVYIEGGTFTMNSGEIINNESKTYLNAAYDGGGGVNLTNAFLTSVVTGTFTMNGGTIANNVSHNIGGGVTAYAGIFNMTGGIITGNSALEGGGVYVSRAFFEKTGGIIYGENAGESSNTATRDANAGQAVKKDGYSHGGRAKVDATHSSGRLYAGENTDAGAWIKW